MSSLYSRLLQNDSPSVKSKMKRFSRPCSVCRVAVFAMMVTANTYVYASPGEERSVRINRTTADKALIDLSSQFNTLVLFPADVAKYVKVNSLAGDLTLQAALDALLSGTGLIALVTEDGVIAIKAMPELMKQVREKKLRYFGDLKNSKLKRNMLATASATVLATSAGVHANAQTAEQGAEENVAFEEIVVTGIRKSLRDASNVKSGSLGVVDAISAEEMGKFPDTNLAESLQRISGVSIDRSGGEGQLITVRGFGPQFNTVLFNGRQIASENLSRAFSFDTIASELVSGISVHKTSMAGLQSGGVGSTVNITTARPFDIDGFKVVLSGAGAYEQNDDSVQPRVSGLISNTFNDGKLGVLLAASYQRRDTRLDQAQTDGWLENVGIPQSELNGGAGFDGNIFSPRNFDNKVTFEERTRTNASLVLQYAATDNLEITVDGLYSDFDIKTDTTSFGHWFTAPNIENAVTDQNGTVIDLFQERGLSTDFHSKKFDRLTETYAIGFRADWDASDSLNVVFDANYSSAERDANNGGGDQLSLIGFANRVRFQSDDAILPYVSGFDTADAGIFSGQQEIDGVAYQPGVTPDGVSDFLDPANSRAHVMLRRGWAVKDEIKQFKIDNTWDEGKTSGLIGVRFGAMFSEEEKALTRFDNEGVGIHCTFCGFPDFPTIDPNSQFIFDAGDDFLDGVSGNERLFTQWLAHNGEDQFAFVEQVSGLSFDAVRRDNSFEVTEKTYAAYVDFDFAGAIGDMPITVNAGVRFEKTDVSVVGTQAPVQSLTILDATEMLAVFGSAIPANAQSSYDSLLPSLNAKLNITDNLIARFAASQTQTRPTLTSMAPVTVIGTTRQGGDLTATSGSPDLEPFTSDNLDFSLEYYYGFNNYLSVGVFRKNVNNFIVNGTEEQSFELAGGGLLTDPSTGTDVNAADAADEVAIFSVTRPFNGESAVVRGIELAAQHTFGETGFGVIANATIVDSDTELDPGDITQIFAVTGLSNSWNVIGFYEKGPYQFRVAYNWRDSFLQSLTQLNGDGVTFVDSFYQIDLSASYDVSENITIFFEGINVTGEIVTKHGRFENQFLNAEDSGARYSLGARVSF